jgi:hypothetical protein
MPQGHEALGISITVSESKELFERFPREQIDALTAEVGAPRPAPDHVRGHPQIGKASKRGVAADSARNVCFGETGSRAPK